MLQLCRVILPYLSTTNKSSISTQISYCYLVPILRYLTVLPTQPFIVNDNHAIGTPADEYLIFREGVGRQGLGVDQRIEGSPGIGIVEGYGFCLF